MRRLRNHGSDKRSCHSYGFNSRLDDLHAGVLSAKLKHIDEWNDQRRKWAARYTAGLAGAKNFTLPYEAPGYRHVFHLYVIETKQAGAARPAARIPERERRRRQVPLPDRHPPAGRLSVGQASADRRPHSELRAQRGLLHLAADVPGADGARKWTTRSRRSWSGTRSAGVERMDDKYRVVVVGHGQARACTMPPLSRPTRV